jgi:hypothetical protein
MSGIERSDDDDPMSYGRERAERLKTHTPDLIADVSLYETPEGEAAVSLLPGFGCPCTLSKALPIESYTTLPQLDAPLHPGERRRIGFIIPFPENAELVRDAGHFFLWVGRFIGEATMVG